MTLVHPSHSVLLAVGLVGFLVVRAALDVRHDVPHVGAALGAIVVPAGLVVVWLLPVVRETVSHSPSHAEVRRAFLDYGGELDVFGLHSYRLTPELFGRAGAIAVASLALLPLAVFAHRRMWAAFVLGGMLVTFAIALLPFVFPHFADAISISQARRIVGFSPRAFAVVGGALVLAGFLRWALLPVALAAGIVLQHYFPRDFRLRKPPERAGEGRAALLPARRPAVPASALRRALATRRPHAGAPRWVRAAARLLGVALRSLPVAMKVLLVTMYWPPAGGGGVQRPLKLATHLPALGIETHVLAPDDPKWLHRDEELRPPTQAFVHRARYLGPKARLPSEELRTLEGFDLALA